MHIKPIKKMEWIYVLCFNANAQQSAIMFPLSDENKQKYLCTWEAQSDLNYSAELHRSDVKTFIKQIFTLKHLESFLHFFYPGAPAVSVIRMDCDAFSKSRRPRPK